MTSPGIRPGVGKEDRMSDSLRAVAAVVITLAAVLGVAGPSQAQATPSVVCCDPR